MLNVNQIDVFYGDVQVTRAVSIEVSEGEIVSLVGGNGAGKSTSMQMITGNLAPSAGRVSINGIDLLDRPKQAKAEIGRIHMEIGE